MCSIAGVTTFDSGQLVDSLLQLMKHRAPDDKGVYMDENISLGMIWDHKSAFHLYGKNAPVSGDYSGQKLLCAPRVIY